MKDEKIMILQRTLFGESSEITVSIFKPYLIETNYWSCSYNIDGKELPKPIDRRVGGLDGIQAILNCFESLNCVLQELFPCHSWTGNNDGDHGFYSVIPYNYGYDVYKELKKSIQELAIGKVVIRRSSNVKKPM